MSRSPITSTVDFTKPGRQLGHLRIPRSANLAGWGGLWIGIGTIAAGEGPTVLALGGTHGDEYEGQFTTLNLLRDLDESDVTGRVISIPCLSPEASRAGTRLWPSGANLNRSFPGSHDGELDEQLADYLTTVLFPQVDVVIDMHSGGRSMIWSSMSHMHVVDDVVQRKAMLEGMLAWNTDFHLLYTDVAGSGLLPVEAENQGKVVITTEAGGGGFPTRRTLDIARDGLRNVLKTVGVVKGEPVTRRDLGLPDAVILDATDPRAYLRAHETGFYETLVGAGDKVEPGQTVGRLNFMERLDRTPEPVVSPVGGYAAAVRAFPWVDQGTTVCVVGAPTTVDEVLSR